MQLALNARNRPATWAGQWYRPVMFGLTMLILAGGLAITLTAWRAFADRGLVGVDLSLFSELGRRWAETDSMYAPWQLEGPYRYDAGSGTTDVSSMPGLYPPHVGPVFALVRFLPPVLWWAIPLGVTAWLIASWRPVPWTWPLMAAALLSANTAGSLVAGNTTMWVVMLVALGLRYHWPAALVALKPTFLPLVLVGWRDRRTWVVLAVLAAVTLPGLGDYLAAMRNVEGASILYSLGDVPLVLVPVIAWIGASARTPLAADGGSGSTTAGMP